MKKSQMNITGMTCSACSTRIEKVLGKTEGVQDVSVNLALNTASVSYDPELMTIQQLESKIESIGFGVAYTTATFNVSGMTCSACSSRIEKVLGKQAAVKQVSVNLATEQASITYNDTILSSDDLKEKVKRIGFELTESLEEKGEEHRSLKRNVWLGVLLSFPLFWAMADHFSFTSFIWVPELFMNPWFQMLLATPVQFVIGARFYKSGYLALKNQSMNMDVLVALGTSAAYFYSVYLTFQSLSTYDGHVRLIDIEIILAMLIMVGFFAVYSTLPKKQLKVDLLILVPILMLYASGYYFATQRLNVHEGIMPDLYFETSAVLITLILVGKLLEDKAKNRSTKAITSLIQGQAKIARRQNGTTEEEIAVEQIKQGDLLIVKAGEKVPVDGVVVNGSTSIDESFITGESLPADKAVGSKVYGSTLNQMGFILVEATTAGNQTVLDDIVRIVKEAQQSKAPIQRFADKISGIFVPIVVAFSILTFIVWYFFIQPGVTASAFEAAIAVLVISCPCALGLATPTSIMAGSGRAAETGILFKGGEHLELANKVTTVVFDKTGTITEGKPKIQEVISVTPDERWLTYVYELEKKSNHPLAQAVVDGLEKPDESYVLDMVEELPGRGMKGVMNHKEILVGNRSLLEKYGVSLASIEKQVKQRESLGETVLFVAVESIITGVITLADKLKRDSKAGIKQLQNQGLDIIMLTGDNQETARSIAAQVGITTFIAGVLPAEKQAYVRALQGKGAVVAMVGDGINDAPALVAADVGIAMGQGADVAVESADIALLGGSLTKVAGALHISHLTMNNIKQNLFWALVYNSIGIPIAAAGLLAPWLAGTAMAFSSVSVVLNALRLQKKVVVKKEGVHQ
ncbi:lead, cadmium, zinc and mercury transporting ATPase [Bacillus sp. JCM 19047]|nr:lead, cadmium, zinc and mercury transporting ATPase [Bacillus sp. JCM 19047]